jgi:hypothetical protein
VSISRTLSTSNTKSVTATKVPRCSIQSAFCNANST